jgi:hypothetical protein
MRGVAEKPAENPFRVLVISVARGRRGRKWRDRAAQEVESELEMSPIAVWQLKGVGRPSGRRR